jgi:hypothetical protein
MFKGGMQSTCLFVIELISQVFNPSVSKLFLLKPQLESLELEMLLHHHRHHHLYGLRHHRYVLCPRLYLHYLKLNVHDIFISEELVNPAVGQAVCTVDSYPQMASRLILLSKLDFDER